MRRAASSALLALSVASAPASAQDQRPLPARAPDALVHPALRLTVVASEELEPDRLRALARPGVSLWLRTRTNSLRESTLENLARFDEAFVQVRLPMKVTELRQFQATPRAGLWIDERSITSEGVLPVRRVAIEVSALTEERAAVIARLRPSFVRWSPSSPPSLLQWALFHQLPGRKVFAPLADQVLPLACPGREAKDPSVELHVATLLTLSSDVFPCGPGTRVIVEPSVDRWLVQSLVVREPSLELLIDVGADGARASKVKALLVELGFPESR